LAATYDLIYPDWDASIAAQGAALDRLLTSCGVTKTDPVLDSACGIGTQTLGLAALGRRMTGSDLSPAAVSRARVEAAARSLASWIDLGPSVGERLRLPGAVHAPLGLDAQPTIGSPPVHPLGHRRIVLPTRCAFSTGLHGRGLIPRMIPQATKQQALTAFPQIKGLS
jgi:SAM-dependent methyltransferase